MLADSSAGDLLSFEASSIAALAAASAMARTRRLVTFFSSSDSLETFACVSSVCRDSLALSVVLVAATVAATGELLCSEETRSGDVDASFDLRSLLNTVGSCGILKMSRSICSSAVCSSEVSGLEQLATIGVGDGVTGTANSVISI